MLRDYARKLAETKAKTAGQGTASESVLGSLTDVQLHLQTPIYGEVEGEPVTIIGQGNLRGYSPVSFCIEVGGENAWLPTANILITDPRFQPVRVTPAGAGNGGSMGGGSTQQLGKSSR